jgi:uncharacterized membrane protein YhdT
MKSYFTYSKEQREKKQKKIDSMKPIERLDYFNRYDRLRERYSNTFTLTLTTYFLYASIFFAVFSVLLYSIGTENSMSAFLFIFEMSVRSLCFAIAILYLAIFEIIFKNHFRNKEINKLDKGYNI